MQCCNTNSCHTECLVERVFVLLVQSYETDLILIYQILSILITRNLWRDNHLASAGAELRILPIIWHSSKKSNAGILQILMCLVLI